MADLLTEPQRRRLVRESPEACLVSALTGEGLDELRRRLRALLPEGPFLYPEDDVVRQVN